MLVDRMTFLKFDDRTPEAIQIDNRIGQGDPLSMVLYQFYNADILAIPPQSEESAIAYIDDALILAIAPNFERMHHILSDNMNRQEGISEAPLCHQPPTTHS